MIALYGPGEPGDGDRGGRGGDDQRVLERISAAHSTIASTTATAIEVMAHGLNISPGRGAGEGGRAPAEPEPAGR